MLWREQNMSKGWIGVDLDKTLAVYDGWHGETHIGEPIGPMVERVKNWLALGIEVRIFTARVCTGIEGNWVRDVEAVRKAIQDWCVIHIGQALPVTNIKDYEMLELWDDRAIQVVPNTGFTIS